MMNNRFWISLNDGHTWREVTKYEYVTLERAMDFHNGMGQPEEPATSCFNKNGIRGTQLIPMSVMRKEGE